MKLDVGEKYDVVTMTFHQSENYGALLQAYALQNAITDLGYKTCIIDYYSVGLEFWRHKIHLFKDGISVQNLKLFIWQMIIRRKTNNFNVFREKLSLSPYYTEETIKKANELSDCFLVGSDQVWNCDCTFEDYHYFLDFVEEKKKKISYAASFGYSEIPEKYRQKSKKLLDTFDIITVRENQGSEMIYKLFSVRTDVVLDPVLLLEPHEWNFEVKLRNKGKYVFVYQAEKSASLIQYAQRVAKRLNCHIYIVSNVWKGTVGKNIHSISDCGPDTFIEYLKCAEYVVTNSFHGTALSILFNKNFNTELLKRNNTNSRLIDILNRYGLEDRIICLDKKNTITNIDYSKINELIVNDRKKSLKILKDMIERKANCCTVN